MFFQKNKVKDKPSSHLLGKYWGYLILLSLLGVWWFDVFYVTQEQTSVSVLSTKALPVLVSVILPRVPLIESKLDTQILPTPAKAVKFKVAEIQVAKIHTATNQGLLANLLHEPTSAPVKKLMNQLTDMNSRHIQFLLPDGNAAKEAFLKHMYRCENMQFGALTNTSPNQLTLLSMGGRADVAFQASELLRLAHDYLSEYERNLFTLYGHGDRPVRIFPRHLDVNIATKIATVVGENQLQLFSARYFLQDSQIGLTEIVLNQKAITRNWIISSKSCY